MTILTAVHISGDLGQALATTSEHTYLVDLDEVRIPHPNEVRLFFAAAMEVAPIDDETCSRLSLDDVQVIVSARARRFELLDFLLAGMDVIAHVPLGCAMGRV